MKKFRIGLIGCGVISDIYLTTCQKFDILDVVACASLDFEESRRKAETYTIPPADWLNYPTVEHGAQGVRFIDAAVESHKAGGAWVDCRLKL